MSAHEHLSMDQRMKTPRAAAIAGIVFSLLLTGAMLLLWMSMPANPLEGEGDVVRNSNRIALALGLLPFAGIAFLWFVGVLRDRFGEMEDQFFATVFIGSGFTFIAMVFTAGTLASGLIQILGSGAQTLGGGTYALARLQIHQSLGYALKMAGVFMITGSTISLRIHFIPRWLSLLGYGLALVLLLLSPSVNYWIPLAFPLWVLLVSAYILLTNVRGTPPGASPETGAG